MTATGEVRPVGGVAAKIRGAARKKCTIISVPKANSQVVDDIYITSGLKPICETQIIAVQTFEEALAYAGLRKTPEVIEALEDFEKVKTAINRNENNARHPKVQAKLRSILKAIPQHYSARLVALHGQGRAPKKLSLVGSLNAIEQSATKLAALLQAGNFRSPAGFDDPLRETTSKLSRIRSSIDPRTKGLLDGYTKIAFFFKERRDKKYLNDGESNKLRQLISALDAERTKLKNNREIQEELMSD